MNTTTLQKCVTELKKESPNIQYVLGMLETIIEMSGQTISIPLNNNPTGFASYATATTPNITFTQSSGTTATDVPDFLSAGPVGNLTNS